MSDEDEAGGAATHTANDASEAPSSSPLCPNCNSAVVGRYCVHCGQEQVAPAFAFFALLKEGLLEFLNADGRYRRTFKVLLLHPGLATKDYFHNRRVRYLPPFRTYLIASLLLFFAYTLGSPTVFVATTSEQNETALGLEQARIEIENDGTLDTETERFFITQLQRLEKNPQQALTELRDHLPQLGIALLPLAAGLLALCFHRPALRYGHHFVALLQVQSAAFLILILIELFRGLTSLLTSSAQESLMSTIDSAATPLIFLHLLLAFRRIYDMSIWATLFRLLAFVLLYSILILLGFALMSLFVLATL